MKHKIYQQAYFENIYSNFPKLNYDDICLSLSEKYPNICIRYTNNNFKYYKTNEEKVKKLKIGNYKLLSYISFGNELLEKDYYKYINAEGKQIEIRIFSTDNNLKNLSDTNINQYYINGTYKLIPDMEMFSMLYYY